MKDTTGVRVEQEHAPHICADRIISRWQNHSDSCRVSPGLLRKTDHQFDGAVDLGHDEV